MIEIFNEQEGKMTFKSYRTLFNYIKQKEKEKILETGETDWDFIVHSPASLSKIYLQAAKVLKILLTGEEQEACEKKLGMLEIFEGNSSKPRQISLAPGMDVIELKKRWCRNYCVEKGYTICEKN